MTDIYPSRQDVRHALYKKAGVYLRGLPALANCLKNYVCKETYLLCLILNYTVVQHRQW